MSWFRVANDAPTSRHVAATLAQVAVFWTTFLVLLPALVIAAEWHVGLFGTLPMPNSTPIGLALFVAASALGLWSGVLMAVRGRGTPLPMVAARQLVCSGPYRVIRNPMALAGIAQGIAVGILFCSSGVVLYALAGAALWHFVVRPSEEQFLAQRFGSAFAEYRERVPLWVPRVLPRRVERWLGVAIAGAGAAAWWLCLRAVLYVPPDAPPELKPLGVAIVALLLLLLIFAPCALIGALLWTRNRAHAHADAANVASSGHSAAKSPPSAS